ncbi:phage tail length tape measure family protein [Devosia sp. 2618]|uniref:phage tail length tape measure family protein n=1 Tax=Devosia sp. 2618 TaxID=3156454 RepID=UPI0033968C3E
MAENAVIGALRVNLGLDTAEFQDGVKAVKDQIGGLGKVFSGLAAVGVFTAFSAGIGAAVGRIEEMRKLSAELDKTLANTGNAAKTSAAEVASFADDLQRSTGRAAEEVMAVSTNLATFGFSREVFFDAIELADDMAAAWGGDLKQNVEGLARALADPEQGLAMLTKRGITFTDQQKEMIAGFIKSNDLIGAQGVVMDALNEQVKGVAEAGFSGLTKASANAWLGVEGFFEAIANGLQINLGLELGLIAIAEALRFVTDNMGLLGRVVAVAGVALMTAMGPAVWTAASVAAVAFGNAAIGAIRAVGTAILLNPIGAIIVAFSAAVAAAFLFRDEIKQAIGIDFVGVVIDAANKTIGAFVGAYEAVKQQWSNLPLFFAAIGKKAWNSFLESFEGPALTIKTPWGSWESGGFDLTDGKAKLTPEEEAAFGKASATFGTGFNRDYIGDMFKGIGTEAAGATANVQGFGDLLAETTSGGGAGLKGLKDAAGETKEAMKGLGDVMADMLANSRSEFSSMATSVVKAFGDAKDGISKALDAVGKAIDSIADKALNQGFGMLFDVLMGSFGGGYKSSITGSGGGFFPGLNGPSLKGLATGGRTMTAGLVEVGERGRELVNLPAGANVIRHSDIGDVGQGGASRVLVELSPDLVGRVLEQTGEQTVSLVKANDKARKNYVQGGGQPF